MVLLILPLFSRSGRSVGGELCSTVPLPICRVLPYLQYACNRNQTHLQYPTVTSEVRCYPRQACNLPIFLHDGFRVGCEKKEKNGSLD